VHRNSAEIDRVMKTTSVTPVDEIQAIAAQPIHLRGFARAGDIWPQLETELTFLHGGPPLEGVEPRAPMLGALIGLLLAKGHAPEAGAARSMIERGALSLHPCHSFAAVGAMAGVVGAETPMVIVEGCDGQRAYAPMNEGLGTALRFGDFDSATLDRLRFLSRVVVPGLNRAIAAAPEIDIVTLQADALRRADEGHNRNVAATSMLATALVPHIVEENQATDASLILRELRDNGHFFLALSMAAAKAMADTLHAKGPHGIVTAIASNGYSTGIRVSGRSDWFIRPPQVDILHPLNGMRPEDADPPLGDSSVTETVGLGAMSLSAAPGLARAIGWSVAQAQAHVSQMYDICASTSPHFQIPSRDFAPAPLGISVDKVLETGILPAFTCGFSHRELGGGRAGFGMVRVARGAFEDAAAAFAQGADEIDA
jgi:hypothetical protein